MATVVLVLVLTVILPGISAADPDERRAEVNVAGPLTTSEVLPDGRVLVTVCGPGDSRGPTDFNSRRESVRVRRCLQTVA
jgi:hypothetical protein